MTGRDELDHRPYSTEIWKWIVGVLVALLLVIGPHAFRAFDNPTASDFEQLRNEVVQNRVELARLNQTILGQVAANEDAISRLEVEIAALREDVQQGKK